MSVFGIDFGMENIKVSCVSDKNICRPVKISNKQGTGDMAPNVIYYKENEDGDLNYYCFDSREVKKAQEDLKASEDVISHIKRQLQYETWKKPVCSGKYSLSAEEISSDIFLKIAEKIKKEQRVEEIEAVLTYPVTFSEQLKKKLKSCAEQAGIKVIEMLTEPFAAMFSDEIIEKFEESKKEYNCIIFDFGGSTLDICLIRASCKEKKKIELLASSGMVFGGYDISELIFNDIILENFKKEIDEADKNHTYSRHASISELRPQAEELKVNLNQSDCEDDDTEEIAFLGKRLSISKKDINDMLDRHEINKKIKDLIINMIDSVDEGMETDDISEVIMVGGTSHMTYFQNIIKEIFEDEDIIDEDILEDDAVFYNSVSCGAARYISEKENYDISKTIPLAVGFDRGKGFEIVLNKNASFFEEGTSKKIPFDFLDANEWKIKIYQSSSDEMNVYGVYDVNHIDVYYTGIIELDKNKFDRSSDIYINMKQSDDGIYINLSQNLKIVSILKI